MSRFPDSIKAFVEGEQWTYAKTMPKWPHEYIVRDRVDEGMFVALVDHIRAHGKPGRFYHKTLIYFQEQGMVYWTMGEPEDVTVIINRCQVEHTYEYRERHGLLPPD